MVMGTCVVCRQKREHEARGMCERCYSRWYASQEPARYWEMMAARSAAIAEMWRWDHPHLEAETETTTP